MKSPYDILISKVFTERTTEMAEDKGAYTFRVALNANKIEIARAVEKAYNVEVANVNTMVVRGKMRRARFRQRGYTPSWKKAIVKLKDGHTIDFG